MGNIVFVVGAGASCEFGGLPVGGELARRIATQLEKELAQADGPIMSAIMSHGGFHEGHRVAIARIINGIHSRDSIDQFIDDCNSEPLVADVAKLAISQVIFSAESISELRADEGRQAEAVLRKVRETWLGRICRYANPHVSRQSFLDTLQGISFVTFNYDRSIERFLLLWAQSVLFKPTEIVAPLVAQVPILHVFGQIGCLPGLPIQGMQTSGYGDPHPTAAWHGAQGIKTFTEEVASEHGARVREVMNSADTVVFLGFHFHQPNRLILFSEGWPRGKRVFATALGLSERESRRLETELTPTNRAMYDRMECAELMARYGAEILEDE